MFVQIESLLFVGLEILCCKTFYEIFGERKKNINSCKETTLLMLLICMSFVSSLLFDGYYFVKVALSIFEIAIIMFSIIKISFVKSLILSFLFEGLLLVVDYCTLLIGITIFGNIMEIDNLYYIKSGLLVLLGKSVLFFAILIVRKVIGNYSKAVIKDSEWLKFTFFPIYTICTIAGMITVLGKTQIKSKNIIFFSIAFGLVGMNIVVFYLINDILKREVKIRDEQLFRQEMKHQTKMYYSISDNLKKQRSKTHEYKNQMICIESLLKRKKYKEMEEYIEQINEGLKLELDAIHTNHVIVDAILNTKYMEMIDKNIVFVFRINDLSKLKIRDEDIVIILSNLLNNAIEACEKCREKKIIKLKFVIEDGSIIISVKNTYENALILQGDKLLTTKSASDEHGIGINNIVNVIERYHGSYVIKHDNREFFFSIIIPEIVEKDLS